MHESTKHAIKNNLTELKNRKLTLKMRSLLSEVRDKPPLYWTVHVSTRVEIITPINLITRKIGNRTTGTAISRETAEASKKWKWIENLWFDAKFI